MATASDRAPMRGPTDKLSPVHPGEILAEEFLGPLGLSQNKAARAMHELNAHAKDCGACPPVCRHGW